MSSRRSRSRGRRISTGLRRDSRAWRNRPPPPSAWMSGLVAGKNGKGAGWGRGEESGGGGWVDFRGVFSRSGGGGEGGGALGEAAGGGEKEGGGGGGVALARFARRRKALPQVVGGEQRAWGEPPPRHFRVDVGVSGG